MPTYVLDITPLQENWDASLQSALNSIKNEVRSLACAISVQGSHTSPSTVNFQLVDLEGNPVARQIYLRVRATDTGGFAVATHATVAVGAVGTLIQSLVSGKDIIVQTDANGLVKITATDTTAETFEVHSGCPDLLGGWVDYSMFQVVVHA